MLAYDSVFSLRSISSEMSSPVTVSVLPPGSSDGVNCIWVMTPSSSTVGVRLNRTSTTTRMNGRSSGWVMRP